jgi:hypothetical protein
MEKVYTQKDIDNKVQAQKKADTLKECNKLITKFNETMYYAKLYDSKNPVMQLSASERADIKKESLDCFLNEVKKAGHKIETKVIEHKYENCYEDSGECEERTELITKFFFTDT